MMKKKGKSKVAASSLILLDSEVRSVRRIVNADTRRPGVQPGEQRVHDALKTIGLLNFLRTVWKWQEVGICSQFVANWNNGKKMTIVKDIDIDVSFQTFVMVTGLLAEESATASDEAELEEVYRTRKEKVWKRRGDSTICCLSEVEVPWFRDLLVLLSRTVWMKCSHPESLSVDLIDSVSEALSGRRLRWSESLHSNFVFEINRLQSQSRQKYNSDGSLHLLKTVGGPVMCFLYIHAKLKAEALAELSGPFPFRKGETLRESIDFPEEESLPGQGVPIARSEITDGELSKREEVLGAPFSFQGVAVGQSDHPPKKRKSREVLNQDNHPPKKGRSGKVSDHDKHSPKKGKSGKVSAHDKHPAKEGKSRKVLNQDKGSPSLPGSPSATEDLETEDLAAKVLELECVIARQNAELAESRLRLYRKGG